MVKEKVLKKIKWNLIVNEGLRLNVYYDHLGNLTVGVGHLVVKKDNLKFGDRITIQQCNLLLENDINIAINELSKIFDLSDYPDNVIEVLIEMMFNLGYVRFSKFKKTITYIKNKDYVSASKEMLDSLWARQVKSRAKKLSDKIANV